MWIYGVCNFSKVTEKKPFANFLWTLFIPGHITYDWLSTVYPDQSLLGFCLSCCPAGEILAHNFKALSFFNCKRESVFIMHVTSGYIHPLPGLLEYAPLQPNGKKAVPLFVPSLKYYSWSLYCLLTCKICQLSIFCIFNQKLIDVFRFPILIGPIGWAGFLWESQLCRCRRIFISDLMSLSTIWIILP